MTDDEINRTAPPLERAACTLRNIAAEYPLDRADADDVEQAARMCLAASRGAQGARYELIELACMTTRIASMFANVVGNVDPEDYPELLAAITGDMARISKTLTQIIRMTTPLVVTPEGQAQMVEAG